MADGMKTCTKCQAKLPATATFFHRDRTMKTGLKPRCKICDRVYRESKRGKEVSREASRNQRLLYPERMKAYNEVNNAIRAGKLIRPNRCGRCFRECVPEAHHENYAEECWLNVYWLCIKCHRDWHKKLKLQLRAEECCHV